MTDYKISLSGKNGIIEGPRAPQFFDLSRGLPGRRKWVGGRLVFEPSRANLECISRAGLKLIWDSTIHSRVAELKSVIADEALARRVKESPPTAVEWQFKTEPYQHQLTAFALCKDRKYFGLFLEMGLGKTKVIIDAAAYKYERDEIDTLIVLSPNGVHRQWVDEQVPIHLPDRIPHKASYYAAYMRKAEEEQWNATLVYRAGLRILSFNIETLQSKKGHAIIERILKSGRCMLVIDESVRIKEGSAARTNNALKLAPLAVCRFIMSGAPVTQGVEDLFTQLNFLHQDVMGYSSFYTFRDHFCVMGGFEGKEVTGYRNMEEFTDRLALHAIRETKSNCLDLPEKIYVRKEVDLTDEQKKHYATMKKEAYAAMDSGELVTADIALLKVLKLQQITSGFLNDIDQETGKLIKRHEFPSRRAQVCADLIEEAQGKVIVWARFHYDLEQISAELTKRKIKFVEYSGRVTDEGDRADALDRFKNGDAKVMIGTARAGGTGLNLTVASTMIYYSNNFSADDRWQSEDRIHRIGQDRGCVYIDLVAKGTVDGHILSALRKKEDIARMSVGAIQHMISAEAA